MTHDNLPLALIGAACLAIAMAAAPLLQGIQIEVGRALGSIWPFSIEHCHNPETPGCWRTQPPQQQIRHAG